MGILMERLLYDLQIAGVITLVYACLLGILLWLNNKRTKEKEDTNRWG